MDVSSPPRYSGRRYSARSSGLAQAGSELPAYSRRNTLSQPLNLRRDPTEHVFTSSEGKGKPWVTLTIYSSAKSPKSLPTYFEKENITGSLELDAERGDSIQSISVTVTGRIISGSNVEDSFVFLTQTQPVWSKCMDIPRIPSPSESASSNKLLGHCIWPLDISIPRSVNIPNGSGDIRSFRLPETFLERHTRVSVQYELTVLVSRGLLRADNKITTAFGYVPSTRPDPPSMLRQIAYQQYLPLPGPSSDPQGWKSLRPVAVRGTLFNTKRAEARCTLSLAKPLCYARGTVLPCFFAMEGADPQILDLLATPSAIVLSLRRRVRFYNKPSAFRQDVAWNEIVEDMGSAVWWPSAESPSDNATRYLEGEIRLAKDLRPTSEVAHFSISYAVVLCPFNATGFTSESSALLSEPVEIVTMHPKGPRINTYSPPAYDRPSRRSIDTRPLQQGLTLGVYQG